MRVDGVLDIPQRYDQPDTTGSTTTRPRGQRLTKEQKHYIVELLGSHCTPSQVARAFQERFGMEVSPQAVQCYDPTKTAGALLSREMRKLFARVRQEHQANIENVGVSRTIYRLQALQDGVETYRERENYLAMAALLEQAAKEVGGVFRR